MNGDASVPRSPKTASPALSRVWLPLVCDKLPEQCISLGSELERGRYAHDARGTVVAVRLTSLPSDHSTPESSCHAAFAPQRLVPGLKCGCCKPLAADSMTDLVLEKGWCIALYHSEHGS